MSNLPAWKAASEVYGKAYRVLDSMAWAGHVQRNWRKCYPSDEMNTLIKALGTGDEQTIKGLLLSHPYFEHQ